VVVTRAAALRRGWSVVWCSQSGVKVGVAGSSSVQTIRPRMVASAVFFAGWVGRVETVCHVGWGWWGRTTDATVNRL